MLNKLIDAIDAPYFDLPWGMATPALILSVIYCFLLLAFFVHLYKTSFRVIFQSF